MAKVSVIIPIYNSAKYLKQCVDSVVGQTFKDIDIVLVDDGSTDSVSPAMCDEYAKNDDRVRVIHKENGGLTSAWSCGVRESSSDYVFFIDSDDWMDVDTIEKYYAHVSKEHVNAEIIAGNCIIEKASEHRKVAHGLKSGEYTGDLLSDVRAHLQGEENRPVTISRCMKLISRQLVLDNIRYCNTDIVMAEDANITLPCFCDCERLVILEDTYTYHYRLVSDSMIHVYNPKLLDNLFLTDKTFREILKDKKIPNADLQMDREFILVLFVVLKNELRGPGRGTTARVKNIFLRDDIRKRIDGTRVNINSKANKLLYFTIKHPNVFTVSFARAVISIYDRVTN